MAKSWTFEDIDWSLFDPQKVNPSLLKVIKTAGVVERNGSDYELYLKSVFAKDPEFQKEIEIWAEEEVKHGKTLAAWVKMADPSYDFDKCFKKYVEKFPIAVEATESIRGSCGAELLARCIVEIGTSSAYSAIKESSEEPLLRNICAKIAADEFRHYKLFYTYFQRYQAKECLSFYKRFKVALGRMLESNSDELATAYYVSNEETKPYNRKYYTKIYGQLIYKCYKPVHTKRAMAMFCKAVGINPQGWIHQILSFLAIRIFAFKAAG